MPTNSDIILVSALPEFEVVEGFLQFTLVSGDRRRTFWISQHKARSAIHTALRVLDDDASKPSNIREFRRNGGH